MHVAPSEHRSRDTTQTKLCRNLKLHTSIPLPKLSVLLSSILYNYLFAFSSSLFYTSVTDFVVILNILRLWTSVSTSVYLLSFIFIIFLAPF